MNSTSLLLIIALSIIIVFVLSIGLLLIRRSISASLQTQTRSISENSELIRGESRENRSELARMQKEQFGQFTSKLQDFERNQSFLLTSFQQQLHQLVQANEKRFSGLSESLHRSLEELRLEVRSNLEHIRKDNSSQLEKIRNTVDEKLHATLENRLGQSFKLVSDSLEKVQKGLGEMQSLAHGVGDLKRVLSNVKTRGMLGEIQLGNILEQILSPEQYALNVATIPSSRNHVEFAIKFPGKDGNFSHVWLPIDSKFPMDKYESVVEAYDTANKVSIEKSTKELVHTVKSMAKDIREKYISPPHTTEFGILFLPLEGLYAEVVKQPGLVEEIQRTYRIMIAGPTNLAAFLNSLQMGFQSLAIEKRSSEVWKILGAVKTEFGKFGEILSKTQKKLLEASNVIDKAGVRTRAIERKLRDVQELPSGV